MKAKLPDYIVREIFCRVVTAPGRVSSSNRFIWKGNCPICGEQRQRMYVKDYGDDHMVYCHNCGYSAHFGIFLRDHYPHEQQYLKEFYLESIKDGTAFKKEKASVKDRLNYNFSELDVKLRRYANKHGFHIGKRQEDRTMEKYRKKCLRVFVKERRLPKKFVKGLWCFTTGPLSGYCGIPFYDESGKNLIHWQGRRMWTPEKGSDDEKFNPKYKFLKDVKEGIEIEDKPFYGENTVNKKQNVMITEGAIDSQCFENGAATSGATISDSLIREVRKAFPNRIWVPDNIWIDKAGLELAIKLLELRESIFVFPFGTKQKDANSYIVDHSLKLIPEELIRDNTYTGTEGLVRIKFIATKNGIEWPDPKKKKKWVPKEETKVSDNWI